MILRCVTAFCLLLQSFLIRHLEAPEIRLFSCNGVFQKNHCHWITVKKGYSAIRHLSTVLGTGGAVVIYRVRIKCVLLKGYPWGEFNVCSHVRGQPSVITFTLSETGFAYHCVSQTSYPQKLPKCLLSLPPISLMVCTRIKHA